MSDAGAGAVASLLRAYQPGLEIRSLEYLGEGDFCQAYALNRRHVVRVSKHDRAARALAREACVLTRIADALPLPVPVPAHFPDPAGGASAISIHERVNGRELGRDVWLGFPAAERHRLARAVGHFLGALHRVDAATVRSCGVEELDHGARARALRARIQAPAGSPLPDTLRADLDAALARYLAADTQWDFQPALLHGDFGPGHVLMAVERVELTGVIDWGDVVIGDPARDFIFVYEDWGPEFLEVALDGYSLESRDRLLPRIHLHYLADQLAWTLTASAEARAADVQHGVTALAQGLRDLESSSPG